MLIFKRQLFSSVFLLKNISSNHFYKIFLNCNSFKLIYFNFKHFCICHEVKSHRDKPPSAEIQEKIRQFKKAKRLRALELNNASINLSFNDEQLEETSYYFENGFRKVYPYFFTFQFYPKHYWEHLKLSDIIRRKYSGYEENYYNYLFDIGNVTVNGIIVSQNYKIKLSDFIEIYGHRHERPVIRDSLKILDINNDMVVIDKPPSVPVHPCGRYRHNSCLFILAKEFGLKHLRVVNRLDRLTSGVMFFLRNRNAASNLREQFEAKDIHKEYVCRVEGEFPSHSVTCNVPLRIIKPNFHFARPCPDGKPCCTQFERMSFNGKSSVVLCKPLTGKMHQIRVHLQYLGFPIINDFIYNNFIFGIHKGKGGTDMDDSELTEALITKHNQRKWLEVTSSEMDSYNTVMKRNFDRKDLLSLSDKLLLSNLKNRDYTYDPDLDSFDASCPECFIKLRDQTPDELMMFLHAWRYKSSKWEYETDLPVWANSDWSER